MNKHDTKVLELVSQAAIYIPAECEAIRISTWDEDEKCFYGDGEETGESYSITFKEVDLKDDMFYKLVALN